MLFRRRPAAPFAFSRIIARWSALSLGARIGFSVAGLLVFAVVFFLVLSDRNWLRGPPGASPSPGPDRPAIIAGDMGWSSGPATPVSAPA